VRICSVLFPTFRNGLSRLADIHYSRYRIPQEINMTIVRHFAVFVLGIG